MELERPETTQAEGLREDLRTLAEENNVVPEGCEDVHSMGWLMKSLEIAERENPDMTIREFIDNERRKVAIWTYKQVVA